MNRPARRHLRSLALIAGAVVVPLAISSAPPAKLSTAATKPPAQLELVHAERFRVELPFRHLWRADQPLCKDGWLLVLGGDAALLRPRQNLEPVLYVGAQTADRVNAGESGRVVVIVPGEFKLEDAPIFFGGEALPEELRQRDIDMALAAARAAGAVSPSAERVANAIVVGRTYASDFELRLRAIDLVEQHSPSERDLIAGWRVPRIR